MSIYNTGVILNKIPTGFGNYTGVVLVNSGNFPVTYDINISTTTLVGLAAQANTLYVSLEKDEVDVNDFSLSKTITVSDSGVFYILHKPYLGAVVTGLETATININSYSSFGDDDLPITIDVTGQRVFDNPTPGKITHFYAYKNYKESDGVNFEFYWKVLRPDTYVKKFVLEISNVSDYGSILSTYNYEIPLNSSNSNYPRYGNYNGFTDQTYNVYATNFSLGTNYYARIKAVNAENESGPYTYAAGFTVVNPVLSPSMIDGTYAGDNLRLNPEILYLNRYDDSEFDFDIFKYMVQNNNNSTDFRRYSGVNISFYPAGENFSYYWASSKDIAPMNCIIPTNSNLRYSVNTNNVFTIELNFEDTALLGYGGEGLKFNPDGTIKSQPQNGGPCFNFDSYLYNGYPIEYRIYKDTNSYFYAGVGGGKGWVITDSTTDGNNNQTIEGGQIKYLPRF